MVGLHHRLNQHEFEQALGAGDGQKSLASCSPWGCRVRHDRATLLSFTEFKLSCVIVSSGPKERKEKQMF